MGNILLVIGVGGISSGKCCVIRDLWRLLLGSGHDPFSSFDYGLFHTNRSVNSVKFVI